MLAQFNLTIMPPKQSLVDELIIALRDQKVMEALATVLESKLLPLMETIADLKQDNTKKTEQIAALQHELKSANERIEALETYSRRDNLLITGMPNETYADSAATTAGRDDESQPSQSVEQSVLKLFNQQLGVHVTPSDISIAHRIKKRHNNSPPITIVKFTNRKAREAVYSARRNLRKPGSPLIYLNEDLNKYTAELFRQTRALVKARRIYNAWTSSCAVFIKETNDINCRPRKISNINELNGL